MRSKKLLSLICAFLMVFSASAVLFKANGVDAAESVKYYYGTTLASSGEGSASITSSLSDGLKVSFKKASKASSANYKFALDMNDFAVSFRFDNANFTETWFKFTDNDNSTKWVQLTFKKDGDKIAYKFKDNYSNETDYKDSGINASEFSSENGLTLSYKKGEGFKLGSQALAADGIETLSFYKNIATMSFGVSGVSGEEDDNDAVMLITSIKNSNGTQSLKTSDSKFEGDSRVAPVIIPKEDGQDGIVSSAVSVSLKAARNAEFVFPYYCVDILGTGWAVSTKEGDEAEGEKITNKLKHSLGREGSAYIFKIYAKSSDENALITLSVEAVKDTAKVQIDNTQLMAFLNASDELQKAFNDNHLVATAENNTFEFPHIYRNDFDGIFTTADALDAFDNVKIQVGYRAPGDSGEFTYASSYAVKLNKTGRWYFRYKITDAAGNETESDVFNFLVFDQTAPTITIESEVEIDVNKKYTIPSATITDNAAGVDTAYSKWTLYEMNADGTKGKEIANIKEGEDGYDDSILKDGVLTPTALTPSDKNGSYILVYEARDLDGNVAEPAEVVLKVVEGTPTYADNPWNDFFRTALIVVACLSGTGIIVLIFVKPKERILK